MWNKVNELSRENLSQQQIVIKLGIHRDTVRRYQMMSESEFNEHLHREARRHPCKLDPYRDFIVDQLVATPFLSSAQVLDHVKEHFPDLPSVSERTVYNVVRRIREEEDIAKEAEPGRSFSHVEDGDWGQCRPAATSKILANENVPHCPPNEKKFARIPYNPTDYSKIRATNSSLSPTVHEQSPRNSLSRTRRLPLTFWCSEGA